MRLFLRRSPYTDNFDYSVWLVHPNGRVGYGINYEFVDVNDSYGRSYFYFNINCSSGTYYQYQENAYFCNIDGLVDGGNVRGTITYSYGISSPDTGYSGSIFHLNRWQY